jgi:hypothetical protein
MYPSNGVTSTDKKTLVIPIDPKFKSIDWGKVLEERLRKSEKQARDNLGGTSDPEVIKRERNGIIYN